MRLAALVVALLAGTAYAEPPHGAYVRVPPTPHVVGAPSSNIIYLHRCPPAGCAVTFGATDDSRTQTSSIVQGSSKTIGAFTEGDAVWNQLVACVTATYKPFAVTVTDVDPGNVPHFENIIGGKATDLRNDLGAGVIGVAPFNCAEIANGISYTFDEVGPDPDTLCWTAAQETAHTFGLEHEFLTADPMTYLQGQLPKRFQWAPAQCGEFMARPCNCPAAMPSSYQLLQTFFGVGMPNPPTVSIDSPTDGKQVQPGFTVHATAMDDAAIDHVELWIDGAMVASTATAPYKFASLELAAGPHVLEARAIAVTTLVAVADANVTMGPPCTADRGCTGTDVCVAGVCVPGPAAQGGLGAQCTANENCLDGLCASDGSSPLMYCAEPCDPSAKQSCPHNFTCATSTSGGLCWASSGCCSAGGDAGGSLALAGVLAAVLRRRRGLS